MTTIVASPPTLQPYPRLGWDGPSSGQGGFSAMNDADVSRILMPQRKAVTRSSSTSSLASNASTATVTSANDSSQPAHGDVVAKKKQRGGFWPVSKTESTASVSTARANGAVQPAAANSVTALNQKTGVTAAVPESTASAVNGPAPKPQNAALLVLLPMNGTFERKQINVPMHPDPPQKIGRQTNNKTTPKADNGYFDSKVLSRSHAEIWADAQGRIWIRDVKSSNGTFVNGTRLSPENRESEPTELRQHDSLELGIDIVSEDQKTIVHHKVSAKVEFAGFPGKAGNALDLLNFGELDPSQGNPLLNSPMSAPMAHSRSQQGRPLHGRGSVASSVAGANVSSVAHRQANYWGTPLNIEQLVKHVSLEMRAAKQQAQDLEHARTYLAAMLPADGSPARLPPTGGKENFAPLSKSNGRVRAPRPEHPVRFTDPPAPPPQHPLPEKPDSAGADSPTSLPVMASLKREGTAKPTLNGMNTAPPSAQSSQILALLESLEDAKKQIESQGSKVKELEALLQQERQKREAAEDKIKRLEQTPASKAVLVEQSEPDAGEEQSTGPAESSIQPEPDVESELRQRIEVMVSQMKTMERNLEQTTQRADAAESERSSLAAMIDKHRRERPKPESKSERSEHDEETTEAPRCPSDSHPPPVPVKDGAQANGHIRAPNLPEQLQHAVATVWQQQQQQQRQADGEAPAQYAPYVSMIGVVLIGVGIMAYLNSWQKVDK